MHSCGRIRPTGRLDHNTEPAVKPHAFCIDGGVTHANHRGLVVFQVLRSTWPAEEDQVLLRN